MPPIAADALISITEHSAVGTAVYTVLASDVNDDDFGDARGAACLEE